MSGVGPISGGVQPDGMFSPSSSSMNMNSNLQGLGNMGGLSPGAQARARQMQIQQAQAMMLQQQLQQQQGQQHQQMGQQQGLQQQLAAQGANMSMGSPQRPTQGTPSPTRQQQMMQAQAASARQMSPPGSAGGLGSGMGMGMNGTDGVASGQQSGMAGNMPQANMNANVNGVSTSSGTNMTLNSQVLASMGPNAMAAYQALQNPSHNMTQFLNQQMPGFSQLPMMEQMRRFQIIQVCLEDFRAKYETYSRCAPLTAATSNGSTESNDDEPDDGRSNATAKYERVWVRESADACTRRADWYSTPVAVVYVRR